MLMMLHGEETAPVSIDPQKVMQRLLAARAQPDRHFMLLAIRDGRLVGYLNIERTTFWYSGAEILSDFGFYVLPKYRGDDVGTALLQEARGIADLAGLPLYIFVNNPTRKRGSRTGMRCAASLLGFVPAGAMLAFGKEPLDVLRYQ